MLLVRLATAVDIHSPSVGYLAAKMEEPEHGAHAAELAGFVAGGVVVAEMEEVVGSGSMSTGKEANSRMIECGMAAAVPCLEDEDQYHP